MEVYCCQSCQEITFGTAAGEGPWCLSSARHEQLVACSLNNPTIYVSVLSSLSPRCRFRPTEILFFGCESVFPLRDVMKRGNRSRDRSWGIQWWWWWWWTYFAALSCFACVVEMSVVRGGLRDFSAQRVRAQLRETNRCETVGWG